MNVDPLDISTLPEWVQIVFVLLIPITPAAAVIWKWYWSAPAERNIKPAGQGLSEVAAALAMASRDLAQSRAEKKNADQKAEIYKRHMQFICDIALADGFPDDPEAVQHLVSHCQMMARAIEAPTVDLT